MKNKLDQQEKEFNLSEAKVQVTIHIEAQTLDLVEESFYLSRKNLPRLNRGKLTKSKFYELLIQNIIKDHKLVAKIINDWGRSENLS